MRTCKFGHPLSKTVAGKWRCAQCAINSSRLSSKARGYIKYNRKTSVEKLQAVLVGTGMYTQAQARELAHALLDHTPK